MMTSIEDWPDIIIIGIGIYYYYYCVTSWPIDLVTYYWRVLLCVVMTLLTVTDHWYSDGIYNSLFIYWTVIDDLLRWTLLTPIDNWTVLLDGDCSRTVLLVLLLMIVLYLVIVGIDRTPLLCQYLLLFGI